MCALYNLRKSLYQNRSIQVAVIDSVYSYRRINMTTQILSPNFLEQGL